MLLANKSLLSPPVFLFESIPFSFIFYFAKDCFIPEDGPFISCVISIFYSLKSSSIISSNSSVFLVFNFVLFCYCKRESISDINENILPIIGVSSLKSV